MDTIEKGHLHCKSIIFLKQKNINIFNPRSEIQINIYKQKSNSPLYSFHLMLFSKQQPDIKNHIL